MTDRKSTEPIGSPFKCQCECGNVHTRWRNPWECGSWHIDCACGKRLKVRILVDVENAESNGKPVDSDGSEGDKV